MGGILETAMLICFGCSWPINLVKNYKCRSAKGMSLPFILLLMVGYIAGISAKFILGVNVHNAHVLVVYLLNLAMVTANLFVYFGTALWIARQSFAQNWRQTTPPWIW
ncbi:MAG: PQ-loop domain-containing transporter [Ruminococcus callidus]